MQDSHEILDRTRTVFVGIDWADVEHAFQIQGPDGDSASGCFRQEAAAIDGLIRDWRIQFPHATFAIAIEQSRGPLISALLKYADVAVYPVNPAALASYRKAFAHGGGKNDPSDAKLLLQYLKHYQSQLRPLRQDAPLTRELASLAEDRRALVDQRAALANELRALLKQYFPAVLAMKPAQMYADFVLRLLLACPTLEQAQRAGRRRLNALLRGGTADKVQQRVALLLEAVPLSEDEVLLRTSARSATALCRRIEVLNDIIDSYNDDLADLVRQHDDYDIVASLPGASAATHCRIIAALGDDRSRYASAASLQAAAGIAPLTTQSGRLRIVSCRWACTKFMKQTFHEYAGLSIRQSRWARAYYHQQLARGKTPQMARRSLAFKWIRIIHRCWRDRVPYDEDLYISRLKQTQSPLYKLLTNAENLVEAS